MDAVAAGSQLEAKGGSDFLLTPVPGHERYIVRIFRKVERGGDVPQVGASETAGFQNLRELGSEWALRQNPLDAGQQIPPVHMPLPVHDRPDFRFKQIRGNNMGKLVQPSSEKRALAS